MNLINYNYFKNMLLKNDDTIKELDYKINIISNNRRDNRWIKGLLLGCPIYLVQSILVLNFINLVPIITTTYLLFSSIILGKSIESILFYKNKYKKQLSKISNNKKFQQLIIEEVNYEIQKEELIAENELLEKMTIHSVKDMEKDLYDLNLDIKDKEIISTLCKKKVLKNKFMGSYNLLDSFGTTIATGALSFVIGYIITSLIYSVMSVGNIIFDIFIPSILVGSVISYSVIRDNLVIAKTFKKFNETLGENRLVYKDFSDNSIELELRNVLDKCGESLMSQCKNTYLNEDTKRYETNSYNYCYKNSTIHSYDNVNLNKKSKIRTRKKELIKK